MWNALVGLSQSIVATVGSAITSSSALGLQQTSAQSAQEVLLTRRLGLLNQKHENLKAQCAIFESQTKDNFGEMETDQIRYTLRYWKLNTECSRLGDHQAVTYRRERRWRAAVAFLSAMWLPYYRFLHRALRRWQGFLNAIQEREKSGVQLAMRFFQSKVRLDHLQSRVPDYFARWRRVVHRYEYLECDRKFKGQKLVHNLVVAASKMERHMLKAFLAWKDVCKWMAQVAKNPPRRKSVTFQLPGDPVQPSGRNLGAGRLMAQWICCTQRFKTKASLNALRQWKVATDDAKSSDGLSALEDELAQMSLLDASLSDELGVVLNGSTDFHNACSDIKNELHVQKDLHERVVYHQTSPRGSSKAEGKVRTALDIRLRSLQSIPIKKSW